MVQPTPARATQLHTDSNGSLKTVSVTTAARLLGVHPNTLRSWTDKGRVRCLRINARGDRRYRISDLELFLAEAPERAASGPVGASGAITREATAAGSGIRLPSPLASRGLALLGELASTAAAGAELDETLRVALDALRDAFGYDAVLVLEVGAASEAARMDVHVRAASPSTNRNDGGDVGVGRRWGDVREESALAAALSRSRAVLADGTPAVLVPDGSPASAVVVPLVLGVVPGALVAEKRTRAPVSEAEMALLNAVAAALALAAERDRLARRFTVDANRLIDLMRAGVAVAAGRDPERVLEAAVDRAMAIFGADRGTFYLLDPHGRVTGAFARNISARYLAAVRDFPSRSLPDLAVRARRPMFATGYAQDPRGAAVREIVADEGYDTIAVAPVFDDEQVIGILALYHDASRQWRGDELDELGVIAMHAGITLTNAREFKRMENWAAQLQSIQKLGARLSRLTSVREIGADIAGELRELIDYHNVRVYRRNDGVLEPVAWRGDVGEYLGELADQLRVNVGEGITGWVAEHGVAQYLPDASRDPRTQTIPGTEADLEESMLLAPMIYEDAIVGVIVLSKLGVHQFNPDDLRLLEIYASFAAQAMANADATEALSAKSVTLERQLRSQRELLRLTESILKALNPSVVLDEVAERLWTLIQADNLTVHVLAPEEDVLRPLIARGIHADRFLAQTLPLDGSLAGWVARHGEPQLVEDRLSDPRVFRFEMLERVPGAIMCVPLRGRDGVAGVVMLERVGEFARFSDDEFELLELFTAQASIAMQNAETHRAVVVRAETDALTGLGNHGAFHQRIARDVARGNAFGLLMIDLDNFKAYNDAWGHQAGDALLKAIAVALRGAGRESDAVYRYGGDEFTLVLPNTDARGARGVAEKVRDAISGQRLGHGRRREYRMTSSIGIATYPADGASKDEMLLAADRACYVAKRSGRNHVATASEGLALAAEFLPSGPTPVDLPTAVRRI